MCEGALKYSITEAKRSKNFKEEEEEAVSPTTARPGLMIPGAGDIVGVSHTGSLSALSVTTNQATNISSVSTAF